MHCKDGVALSLNGQYVADQDLPQPIKAIYGEEVAQICADAWKAVGLEVTEGILSGIQDITNDSASADGTLYNVLGIPVTPDYKSVVIKNGKKIYNK